MRYLLFELLMACIISEEVHWCSTFRLCGEHSKRTKQDDRLFCWRWGLGGTWQWEEWLIGSWRSQVEQTEKSWWWERLLEGEWCKGCFVVLFWFLCAMVFLPWTLDSMNEACIAYQWFTSGVYLATLMKYSSSLHWKKMYAAGTRIVSQNPR